MEHSPALRKEAPFGAGLAVFWIRFLWITSPSLTFILDASVSFFCFLFFFLIRFNKYFIIFLRRGYPALTLSNLWCRCSSVSHVASLSDPMNLFPFIIALRIQKCQHWTSHCPVLSWINSNGNFFQIKK